MPPYPNPTATARNNLARRVERFLKDRVDPAADHLTDNELGNLLDAMRCLRDGGYDDGERAMLMAEKAWPPRDGTAGRAPSQTVEELLDEVRRVLAG